MSALRRSFGTCCHAAETGGRFARGKEPVTAARALHGSTSTSAGSWEGPLTEPEQTTRPRGGAGGRASALDGQSFSLAGQELWRCQDAPCALRQGGPHASELCAWRGSDGEILRVFYYNKKILGKTH